MARVYLIFSGTHETLRAESVLHSAGLTCKVVTKPAAIRLDCGLALRTEAAGCPDALATLRGSGMVPRGVFTL